jgi:hypothetical protein
MNERRAGLEKSNVSVEPAKDGRRPQLALEASNIRTGSGRRGSGVDMCSKEKRVNMGSPPWREERSQPAIREEQAGLRRVAERSVVAMKRVLIVERRDLSSRATLEVQKRFSRNCVSDPFGLSVSGISEPFLPFPDPAHQTGFATFSRPAFGQGTQRSCTR